MKTFASLPREVKRKPNVTSLKPKKLQINDKDDETRKMWIKERNEAFASKNREITRLQEKHLELVRKLGKLNQDLEEELGRAPGKTGLEPLEILLMKVQGSIDCAHVEDKILNKELDSIKGKLSVDVGYDRIVALETELRAKLERNAKMNKQMARQERGINIKDKRYCNVKQEIDNAKPVLVEEERLLKHINKEIEKQRTLDTDIEQNVKTMEMKLERTQGLEAKVVIEERELEEVKKEFRMLEDSKRASELDEEFKYLSVTEVKELLIKVKSEQELERKRMADEKGLYETEARLLREKFKELSRQRKINGHKVLEMTRLIKLNQDKAKRLPEKEEKKVATKDMQTKVYQNRLRNHQLHKATGSYSSSPTMRVDAGSAARKSKFVHKAENLEPQIAPTLPLYKATKDIEIQTSEQINDEDSNEIAA